MWIQKRSFLVNIIIETLFWPQNQSELSKRINVWFKCALTVIFVTNVTYVLKSTSNGIYFEKIALNLAWLTSFFFGSYVVCALKGASKMGRNIWNYVESNPQFNFSKNRLERMIKTHTLIMNVSMGYTGLAVLGGFLLFEYPSCAAVEKEEYCGLLYPSDLFNINLSQRSFREIFNFTFCLYMGYCFLSVQLCVCLLHLIITIARECLEEFQSVLLQIQRTKSAHLRRQRIIKAYNIHQFIKKVWLDANTVYKWPLFVQYLSTGVIVALILISELIKFDLISVAHVGMYIGGVFLMGYLAEEMKEISQAFKDATFYHIPCDGDIRTAKDLMFMNINLRRELEVSLGNYPVYSNELVLLTFNMVYSIVMVFINSKQ